MKHKHNFDLLLNIAWYVHSCIRLALICNLLNPVHLFPIYLQTDIGQSERTFVADYTGGTELFEVLLISAVLSSP